MRWRLDKSNEWNRSNDHIEQALGGIDTGFSPCYDRLEALQL